MYVCQLAQNDIPIFITIASNITGWNNGMTSSSDAIMSSPVGSTNSTFHKIMYIAMSDFVTPDSLSVPIF